MQYMLTKNEERIAEEWKKYQGYTVRPLSSTTNYYRKVIQQNTHKENFLLYGGTPEIRSIFQELALSLTMLDRSSEIVRAMGRLTAEKIPIAANEQLINLDWLYLESLERTFDFVIGDDAINMVRWTDFELFLTNTQKLLADDGVFICHLLVKPDDALIEQRFSDLINQYNHQLIPSHFDLASRLNFICFEKTTYTMGWQRTINIIGKDNLAVLKPHFNFVDLFGFCNSYFCCPPRLQFEQLVRKYFCIEEIFYPYEHEYCRFEPIYFLRK